MPFLTRILVRRLKRQRSADLVLECNMLNAVDGQNNNDFTGNNSSRRSLPDTRKFVIEKYANATIIVYEVYRNKNITSDEIRVRIIYCRVFRARGNIRRQYLF